MEKNLKNYKKMLQEQGCFYTDEAQANLMISELDGDCETATILKERVKIVEQWL